MNTSPAEEEATHKFPFVYRHYKKGIFVALTLLLWPLLIVFPWGTDASLDGSWPEVLLYAHLKGWQFGRDIIFTWGPWGFLNNQFHLGAAGATTKILWESLGKLAIAASLVALTRKVPLFWQILFITACILFSWIFLDTIFLVLITLIVIGGLMGKKTPLWQQLLYALALAFLAQIKFTYTVLACAGIVFSALRYLLCKDCARAAAHFAAFAASFMVFWMGAGQNPDNILAFFRTSLEISVGYGWAMGADERLSVFLSCLALALGCAVFVWHLWRTLPDRPLAWAATLYLGGTWFVVWKHGMVRADGHEMGFVLYSMLLALVLPFLCIQDRRWHWFVFGAVWGIVCLQFSQPGLLANCPRDAQSRFAANYRALMHLNSLPETWETSFNQAARQAALPHIRQIVGSHSIDVFNYDQGVALLNRFNYTPRPIFQSYSAYTPRLMSRNLRFYRSPRAPEYILWNQSSIDARYPTIDDALLIPELLRAYKPAAEENGYLLLKKTAALPEHSLKREPLLQCSLELGEVLTLPSPSGAPVWFQASLKLTKLGKLRAFFYKPPLMNLIVTDETGNETTWRLLPLEAEEGFLLSPLLDTQSEFLAYCRDQRQHLHRIQSLRLVSPRKQKEFWPRGYPCAEVQLFSIEESKTNASTPSP
jgi:hypothetical protein